jgi:glycosyltransferase involved in cell wall biosynthesis
MKKKLSLVLPTYNEAENIQKVLKEAVSAFRSLPYEWEILVVDNASQDSTRQKVAQFTEKYGSIKAIFHPRNLGYGASTKTGLHAAKGDIIIVMDSDGQHTAKDISRFISKINEGYGLVVGWKKKRKDPFLRVLLSNVYNMLFRLIFGIRLHDVDCGYKAYDKSLAKGIKLEYTTVPNGTEICAKAAAMGYRIAEIEVHHFPRKKGKSIYSPYHLAKTVLRTFLSLIALKVQLSRAKK